jgi:hypothetical protein
MLVLCIIYRVGFLLEIINLYSSIHELADTIVTSYGICQEILTENSNMHRISSKFVPRLLTKAALKQRCINMCHEPQENANEDPAFISRIITDDKSWIYG